MAVASAQVSVGTTATLLSAAESDSRGGSSLALSNGGSVVVYLGASGVTTSTGFPLAAGGTASLDIDAGEVLYGVVASGTATVSVLRSGV